MVKRKKGYRKRFKPPPKGCKPYKGKEPWKSRAKVAATGQLLTFTEEPLMGFVAGPVTGKQLNDDCGPFLGFDEDIKPNQSFALQAINAMNSTSTLINTPLCHKLRVLSLFDGISTGFCALQSLNFHIEVYYSSEIDKDALKVQRYHFYDEVRPLGCVKTIDESVLASLGPINLLLANSPCENVSLVNPLQQRLDGKGSTDKLFSEFLRIRNHLLTAAKEKSHLFFWLYGNTASLEKASLEAMSRSMQCNPIQLCSSSCLGMESKINFWGNLPLMCGNFSPVSTKQPQLQDVLKPYRRAQIGVLNTVSMSSNSQCYGDGRKLPVIDYWIQDGSESSLHVTELEQLFGLPEHFTDVEDLSATQRQKLIGKALCVNVLRHLLKPLLTMFQSFNNYF